MESMIMPKQVSIIQLAAGNPVGSPGSIAVNTGSVIIWSTTSQKYPEFKIKFVGSAPPSTGNDLLGSVDRPVAIVVSAQDKGDYTYEIEHIEEDGTCAKTGPFPFSVRGDPGGDGVVALVDLPTDQEVNQATADPAAMAMQ
jgi:hypothetical protein